MLRVLIAVSFAMLATLAMAETRVALVIGNSAYEHSTPLPNPTNDARAVADKLTRIGFDVMLREDLGGQKFRIALGEFTEKALRADVALVFYAGHGIEMAGDNYMIPIDAEMRSEATAVYEAVKLDAMLMPVRQAGKLGMVLIDACRDNPFASTMQRNNGTRSLRRGLAPITLEGESGLVVSFAAEAGSTADDGAGEHSPYTEALLEVLDEPGLEVGRMFRKVRARVRSATDGKQVPIERMQLPDEEIYLVALPDTPDRGDPLPGGEVEAPTRPPAVEDPLIAYINAVRSGRREDLEDFIQRYPDHPKAGDARKLLLDMADTDFWAQTLETDTEDAYRTYLIVFPGGRFAEEARARLAAYATPAPEPAPRPPVVIQPQPPVNRGPSFDCGKASTSVERAICGSSVLSRQDSDLAAAYKAARANGWVGTAQQRSWITQRNAVCKGVAWSVADCVQTISGDRINALRAGRLSGNIAPGFNCARAGTRVERAICGSDVLGRQDQLLLQVYKSARSRNTSAARNQRAWIGQRESRCSGHQDVAWCVASYTADRLGQLAR